jgi:hypothetical protein
MIRGVWDEWLIILRYAEITVGWVVRGKKSIEKPVETTIANKTDVTDLHAAVQHSRIWVP